MSRSPRSPQAFSWSLPRTQPAHASSPKLTQPAIRQFRRSNSGRLMGSVGSISPRRPSVAVTSQAGHGAASFMSRSFGSRGVGCHTNERNVPWQTWSVGRASVCDVEGLLLPQETCEPRAHLHKGNDMSSSEDKGKRPARRMGLLIAALVIGAVILVVLWMRDPPPGVKPSTSGAPQTLDLATGLASHDCIPSASSDAMSYMVGLPASLQRGAGQT